MTSDRRDAGRVDRRVTLPPRGTVDRRDSPGRRADDRPEDLDHLLARAAAEPAIAARLIDVAVVAERLNVSTNAVRNWILTDRLLAVRTPTGRYRVPISELARVIKSAGSHASHDSQDA